jgi:hypothetical protein
MVSQKEFNKRLKDFSRSKVPLKILLNGIEMKSKYQTVLWDWYIEEKSYAQIAEELHMTQESIGNLLCEARTEFNSIISEMGFLLADDLQPYIKFLTNNND